MLRTRTVRPRPHKTLTQRGTVSSIDGVWSNPIAPWLSSTLSFHAGPLPGEPDAATFATVDGVRLRYVEMGSGPAVVFIHGFAASLDMWRRTQRVIARRGRAIAIDLKGFGWSARPPGDYSQEAQAALLWKFLDRLGIENAALVGHSWGASVALAMALQAPERVRRIALYSAWVYQEQLPPFLPFALGPWVGETLFSWWYQQRTRVRLAVAFHDLRYVTRGMVGEAERLMALPGSAASALAALRAMDFAMQQRRYPRIEAPSLLLWGEGDTVTPPSIGRRLQRDLRASLKVYPRCGHFPMVEAARSSARDLTTFLGEDR